MESEHPVYRPRSLYETSLKNQYHQTAAAFYESLAEKGELRAPDDTGGGTTEDISNIHRTQE